MAVDIKQELLKLGEENAKLVWKNILRPLLEEKIQASENKIDDLVLPFMQQVENALMGLADKIHQEPVVEPTPVA